MTIERKENVCAIENRMVEKYLKGRLEYEGMWLSMQTTQYCNHLDHSHECYMAKTAFIT
jgi:hypothetical protein